jgi:hypothetical protein
VALSQEEQRLLANLDNILDDYARISGIYLNPLRESPEEIKYFRLLKVLDKVEEVKKYKDPAELTETLVKFAKKQPSKYSHFFYYPLVHRAFSYATTPESKLDIFQKMHPDINKNATIEDGLNHLFKTFPNERQANLIFEFLKLKGNEIAKAIVFFTKAKKKITMGEFDEVIDILMKNKIENDKTRGQIISILNNLSEYSDIRVELTKRIIQRGMANQVLKSDNSLLRDWIKTPVKRMTIAKRPILNFYKFDQKPTGNTSSFTMLKEAAVKEIPPQDSPTSIEEKLSSSITTVREVKSRTVTPTSATVIKAFTKAAPPVVRFEEKESSLPAASPQIIDEKEYPPPPAVTEEKYPVPAPVIKEKSQTDEKRSSAKQASIEPITQKSIPSNVINELKTSPNWSKRELKEAKATIFTNEAREFTLDSNTGNIHTANTDDITFIEMFKTFKQLNPAILPEISINGNNQKTFNHMLEAFKKVFPGENPTQLKGNQTCWEKALEITELQITKSHRPGNR